MGAKIKFRTTYSLGPSQHEVPVANPSVNMEDETTGEETGGQAGGSLCTARP